jgi:hypothetical protein
MTEKQFRAWLRVKTSNLELACGRENAKGIKLLDRLTEIYAEACRRWKEVVKEG